MSSNEFKRLLIGPKFRVDIPVFNQETDYLVLYLYSDSSNVSTAIDFQSIASQVKEHFAGAHLADPDHSGKTVNFIFLPLKNRLNPGKSDDRTLYAEGLQHYFEPLDQVDHIAPLTDHPITLTDPPGNLEAMPTINDPQKLDQLPRNNLVKEYNPQGPDFSLETFSMPGGLSSAKIKLAFEHSLENQSFIHKVKQDSEERRKIVRALVKDCDINRVYPSSLKEIMIKGLQTIAPKSVSIKAEYAKVLSEMKQNPSIQKQTESFSSYIDMYEVVNTTSMQSILYDALEPNQKPNPKVKLYAAQSQITQAFTPYLLTTTDDKINDADRLVMFDASQGIWIHNPNIFSMLLNIIRPDSSKTDVNTFMQSLAAEARAENHIIKPYNQSRHLVFNNGVLDLKTMKLLDLKSPEVQKLHFTERSHLNIDYDETVTTPPHFPNRMKTRGLTNDNSWNPRTFLQVYANALPDSSDTRQDAEAKYERYKWLCFCLALGLFGGHNFGVNCSIKGPSGFGKSSLRIIYDSLFNGRVVSTAWRELNKPFPFSGFPTNTSLVWISECNINLPPLDATNGISNYDKLADRTIEINNKGKNNTVIVDPPTVYIDGTSYVTAQDMDTGPVRRTIVYRLPDNPKIREYAQGIGIEDLLSNTSTLQFLINEFIHAYKHTLNLHPNEENSLWDLNLELSDGSPDIEKLPACAQQWRREFIEQQGQLRDWFDNQFIDFINKVDNPNDPDATLMHDDFAYQLYINSYKERYSNSDPNSKQALNTNSFKRQLHILYGTHNWEDIDVGVKGGKLVKNVRKMHFRIDDYTNSENHFTLPRAFEDSNVKGSHRSESSYPLNTRTRNWYYLIYHGKIDANDRSRNAATRINPKTKKGWLTNGSQNPLHRLCAS